MFILQIIALAGLGLVRDGNARSNKSTNVYQTRLEAHRKKERHIFQPSSGSLNHTTRFAILLISDGIISKYPL